MSVTYQSTQTAASNTGTTSVVLSKPTSTAYGDLLVAHIVPDSGTTITPPSDTVPWTQLTTNLYYKLAGASEPSGYTFTLGNSRQFYASCSRFTGPSLTAPINTSTLGASGTGTTVTIGAVTPSVANCLLLFFIHYTRPGGDTPGSSAYAVVNNNPTWTERFDNGANNEWTALATGTYTATTTTGNATATLGQSYSWVGNLIAVAPDAGVTISADLVSATSSELDPAFAVEVISPTSSVQSPDMKNGWTLKPKNSAGNWPNQTKH